MVHFAAAHSTERLTYEQHSFEISYLSLSCGKLFEYAPRKEEYSKKTRLFCYWSEDMLRTKTPIHVHTDCEADPATHMMRIEWLHPPR
jgi:hypothetical protein